MRLKDFILLVSGKMLGLIVEYTCKISDVRFSQFFELNPSLCHQFDVMGECLDVKSIKNLIAATSSRSMM